MYCSKCKKECKLGYIDLSFDHEFGTKTEGVYVSSCCSVDLYKDKCDTCNANGKINGEKCPDCNGVGLINPVDEEF